MGNEDYDTMGDSLPPEPESISVGALADQVSQLIALCADTNASVKRTEATVGQLAEVLKSFAEVNPQELMGLLGGMMGK